MKLWCCHGLLLSTARPWNLCHCVGHKTSQKRRHFMFLHCFDMVSAFSEANHGWVGNEMHMSTGWPEAIDGAGPAPKEIRFIRPKVPKRSRDLWWCANQCHTLIVTVGLGGNNFPAAIISTICPKLWLHSAFPSEVSHPMPFRDLLSWTRGYWDPHFFIFFPPDSTIPKLLSWLKSPGGEISQICLENRAKEGDNCPSCIRQKLPRRMCWPWALLQVDCW